MAKEETGQLPAIPVLVHGAENRIKIRHAIIANTVRNAKKVLDVVFSTFSCIQKPRHCGGVKKSLSGE